MEGVSVSASRTPQGADSRYRPFAGSEGFTALRLPLLLVSYLVFLLVFSWAGFFVGIQITRYHFPLLSLAFGYAVWARFATSRKEILWMGAFVIASLGISLLFIDRSWDSLWYHKRAMIALADGWNPVYQALNIKDLPWPDVYWKTTWVLGALAYKSIPIVNVVTFVNWILLLAAFFTARAALSVARVPPRWINLVAALIALNPVSILQLTTSYVDGAVASCVVIVTCALLGYCMVRQAGFLVLACFGSALALTVKVSCITYLAGVWLAAAVFVVIMDGWRGLRLVSGTAIATAVLTVWLGFNPYVTNYMRYGNPLHPLFGAHKIDNIITQALPRTYAGRSRLESLAISVFSGTAAEDAIGGVKFPGTMSIEELKGMHSPALKVGGFGPLFSVVLLLAAAGLLTIPMRGAIFASLAGVGLIAVSLVNPAVWWARYVPWLWLLPMVVLVVMLVRGRGPISRWFCVALTGVSIANVVICLIISLGAAAIFTLQTSRTILEVRHWPEPVSIERTQIPSHVGGVQELHFVPRRLLTDLGVRTDEVDSCAGAQRMLPYFKSSLCSTW